MTAKLPKLPVELTLMFEWKCVCVCACVHAYVCEDKDYSDLFLFHFRCFGVKKRSDLISKVVCSLMWDGRGSEQERSFGRGGSCDL